MQIIIDVPIDTHYHIKKRNVSESDIKIILEAISKGTPFPKEISKNTSFPKEHGWIPVSERLPEKNVEVLATTEWGAVTIAEMYSANDWFIHEGTTNAEADEIVAWMPLPKPFKPQESEE